MRVGVTFRERGRERGCMHCPKDENRMHGYRIATTGLALQTAIWADRVKAQMFAKAVLNFTVVRLVIAKVIMQMDCLFSFYFFSPGQDPSVLRTSRQTGAYSRVSNDDSNEPHQPNGVKQYASTLRMISAGSSSTPPTRAAGGGACVLTRRRSALALCAVLIAAALGSLPGGLCQTLSPETGNLRVEREREDCTQAENTHTHTHTHTYAHIYICIRAFLAVS